MAREEIDAHFQEAYKFETNHDVVNSLKAYDEGLRKLHELRDSSQEEERQQLTDFIHQVEEHVQILRNSLESSSASDAKGEGKSHRDEGDNDALIVDPPSGSTEGEASASPSDDTTPPQKQGVWGERLKKWGASIGAGFQVAKESTVSAMTSLNEKYHITSKVNSGVQAAKGAWTSLDDKLHITTATSKVIEFGKAGVTAAVDTVVKTGSKIADAFKTPNVDEDDGSIDDEPQLIDGPQPHKDEATAEEHTATETQKEPEPEARETEEPEQEAHETEETEPKAHETEEPKTEDNQAEIAQ